MATTALKPADMKPAATALIATSDEPQKSPKHYRGFVAGVFSGIAKLSGVTVCTCCLHPYLTRDSWAPLRHSESATANDRKVAFQRSSRLSHADFEKGGLRGVVQRRDPAVGGVDVYGLDV